MPVQSMQRVAEHSLFKAALPLVCAALIGSITWIFVTVMDIDKVLHRVEDSEIPQINKDIAKNILNVEETDFTTIPMAENLIDNMRNEKEISKEKLDYVNEIDSYISEIRKSYEGHLNYYR